MKYIKNNNIILKTSKKDLSDMFPRKHLETLFGTFEKKVVPCFKKISIINYIINYINCPTFASQGKTPKYENPLIIINYNTGYSPNVVENLFDQHLPLLETVNK
jgi:hypothetical protein